MSFLKSAVFELAIVLILSLLLITGLNYFRVISLNSFPILSFLPQQNLKTPLHAQLDVKTFALITPKYIRTISSKTSGFSYQFIDNSRADIKGQMVINGEMSTVNNPTNTFTGSGITFENNYEYFDSRTRRLIIFYLAKNKNWMLEFRGNGKSKYYYLAKDTHSIPFIQFTFTIDPSGKSLEAAVAGQKTSIIAFPSSLYDKGRKMYIVARAAPNSDLTIYSLYYQYEP